MTAGRPPIGKRAMTTAERQRRRRKKLDTLKSAKVRKAEKAKTRDKIAESYIPTPPGVTYWSKVTVILAAGGTKEIWEPRTKPLAACTAMLDDADVLALIERLGWIARERGFMDTARAALERGHHPSGVMVCGPEFRDGR